MEILGRMAANCPKNEAVVMMTDGETSFFARVDNGTDAEIFNGWGDHIIAFMDASGRIVMRSDV